MRLLLPIVSLFLLFRCSSTSIPYPPAPPKDSVETFLPGIVSLPGDSLDFNALFSPDGKSFYFARSRGNRSYEILVTTNNNGAWSKPKVVDFNGGFSNADPAFGPDGFLYFISTAPKDANDTIADYDIWFVRPEANGWSKPENLTAVNTDSTEYYVSFAGDGNLYFASSRPGGQGQEDIYVSRRVNGEYTTPENLGPQVNTPNSDHDAALPKNESFVIYTSDGDLHYSIKNDDNTWSPHKPLDKLNTSTYEYCSYFSPDQKYFFFSSRYDVRWTPIESLPEELYKIAAR